MSSPTKVLDNDHNSAGPSGCHDVKSSCYRTYTNLFGPIIIDDDDEDEIPVPDKTNDMASEDFESSPACLQGAKGNLLQAFAKSSETGEEDYNEDMLGEGKGEKFQHFTRRRCT
ncbi:uncharacterized protein LOC117249726 [Xyrichtys novacula]|uniref:Uncharacterized protein LOC117249726 n=1 Tax=Xyrichtys novacula TaxID=13765 RepID=A0AAV1GH12_XYRNO|nr:uncharacterized protein LOC117249726 [Xyrichtys novacula]